MKGDVTRTHVEWDEMKRIPTLPSPLVVDGKIYITSELGVLSRIDGASGRIEESLPLGGRYSSSGVHADGHLFFLSEEGETQVVRPGDKMELVATNPLADGFMASAALDGSSLYLRTKSHIYRIGKTP
jgi:outer membrane protein assembly factor BamB